MAKSTPLRNIPAPLELRVGYLLQLASRASLGNPGYPIEYVADEELRLAEYSDSSQGGSSFSSGFSSGILRYSGNCAILKWNRHRGRAVGLRFELPWPIVLSHRTLRPRHPVLRVGCCTDIMGRGGRAVSLLCGGGGCAVSLSV